ncbi:MAG: hypothetical protein H7Z43_03410 [Clostridia bacterium]|nr:hypothetical protein [Deltaproteobacteria bacterium]
MMKDDDEVASRTDAQRSRIPDSIRKAVVGGLSAVFTTEEGIRNVVSDMRLPKDAIAYLAQQTERTRREVFRAVSEEVKGFLRNIDAQNALRKALAGMRVEVKAELRFIDEGAENGGRKQPAVKHQVRVDRGGVKRSKTKPAR